MSTQIPANVPPPSIVTGLIYDPPFLIAQKCELLLAYSTTEQHCDGQFVNFWVPVSPDPNYVNVSHYVNITPTQPVGNSVIAVTGKDEDLGITYPEFLFVLNDPSVSQQITTFGHGGTSGGPNWNTDLSGSGTSNTGVCYSKIGINKCTPVSAIDGANHCYGLAFTSFGCCTSAIFSLVAPSTDFVPMGNAVVAIATQPPYPSTGLTAAGTDSALYAIYAVNKKFVVNLMKPGTDADFIVDLNDFTGATAVSVIFPGPYHTFLATDSGNSDPRVFSATGQSQFDKMSFADMTACCTQTPSFFIDPQEKQIGNVTATRCGAFFPPSVACDPVLTQLCSSEILTQPIVLKNPRCGCCLPPQFYATSNLLGPVECASQTCTSVTNAYKLSTQTATVCQITNCVINSNQINGNNLNINTILYEQNCGQNVTGKGTPGGSSSQTFLQFLLNPLILAILITGVVIFIILIIVGATTGGAKGYPAQRPPGGRVLPVSASSTKGTAASGAKSGSGY